MRSELNTERITWEKKTSWNDPQNEGLDKQNKKLSGKPKQ